MTAPQSPIFITHMRDGKWRVECHSCFWWTDLDTQEAANKAEAIHGKACGKRSTGRKRTT